MKETSLTTLMDMFDVFLLDQFGVLLDGPRAYPGAASALASLAARGKTVGILTNSGKRSAPNAARLSKMGLNLDHIDAVISSGEVARTVMRSRLEGGAKVLVLSRDDDAAGIEDLRVTPTDDPNTADLVLIAGSRGEEWSLDHYREILKGPAARAVPALCTNPDMLMLTERGRFFGAGRIAALYRDMGGSVDEIGKPHELIYQVALEQLGAAKPDGVLCIGDSPAHDVRGAHSVGCKAALVRTGIHAGEPMEHVLARARASDIPDFLISAFEV